jgi:tetratricopeptide (TPR) repeat protein
MSPGHPDPELMGLIHLFANQAFQQAADALDQLPPPLTPEGKAEFRRLRGWIKLALGETEQAYDLFWSCADHPGGRAGILVLTVLAGQVTVAMTHWQRMLQERSTPPLELPDAMWHSRSVALGAIAQLARYPFPPGSHTRGAAALYSALLHRATGDSASAFSELSKVADYYAPADLVRDRWLEQMVCLPAPAGSQSESALLEGAQSEGSASETATPSSAPPRPPGATSLPGPEAVVQMAARLLLYPDPDVLERQCKLALDRSQWQDALEILDRLLLLAPNHTGGLETRWRLYIQLGWPEAAKSDLFALVDIYEREGDIVACQEAALKMVGQFPADERAMLKMCFLQARLGAPLALAHYGRQLLALCRQQELLDRFATYRLWLLRQDLSLDDRSHFEAARLS